ncbi:rhamnose utilization protein RhaD (predicted bifunctional aldolase and dehydrogenase)/NAD(P)-dependent dehydrogenase (short-subunit alcohol dehydrogenase family) [Silvibacterium bohemicum]|uniref:Rhamnose utilization protein RhaD (Predicted bifunctional aldolase and dehydrogenase)/NAD(P)-dependent dehydrogenase (Short-subunit alcohol dehydrogenase family) n=1 Tax=Silvibacterium bohemicum TaxID=1577686 RepID=A0A841JVI1_9BACT|nr:bifunctional rhamnulose-1-phosphate aldolase/short-chain dehydrogenase [Silvibacterium bohemicum]MBB6145356.1 rhamnose utilization protein RhaD (predicted bifunctional aldolase and dehydrogenase)/NAD(P)-dependent dehydrogenase (short-subunit alcohol dehydrogenase family) [Silvibacterium bohemicum]
MAVKSGLRFLEDRWDDAVAAKLDAPELLRYRSNLLGSDLRITNFGGGNTSSKLDQVDPLTGQSVKVLWVKGSGGDLGSIKRQGFATLYMDKLLSMEKVYPGVAREDEMVAMYPLITFGNNPVAASIDTPLHGFLPFPHVDHLHPDWAIALAASANGKIKMEEFNKQFGHKLVWLPWQRPGFELAMMLKRAVEENPGCDGIILGGHGLFTWGNTQRESYLNTITIIDQIGQFIDAHATKKSAAAFGGSLHKTREDRATVAQAIFPRLRGAVSRKQRWIGTFTDSPDVLEFVNSKQAQKLAHLGTSCPDHFIRTKIRPMYLPWNPKGDAKELQALIDTTLETYRKEYGEYYAKHALKDSPAIRDASPTVVLVPGVGMFTFGKNKTESRLTGEFYTNAIHVMQGAGSLGEEIECVDVPQAGPAAGPGEFTVYENYVALPPSEAFRIEYWALEEAKIRRQPPEKELSRRIALVVGGGSGIGREVALLAAERGAHVVVADRDTAGAEKTAEECKSIAGKEAVLATSIDIRNRETIKAALHATIKQFGGVDMIINTAAIFPSSPDGVVSDAQWALTLEINVTANYLLADEAQKILDEQGLDTTLTLTSSANAVVAKKGSEAYDVSKAALSHLIRELAVRLSPRTRVNGISPATVVKGSTMFPRDRVKASLAKYAIAFAETESDDELRNKLAQFYAQRTLTHVPIDPKDCAQAILFLAGPLTPVTTGHLIPVDGGLVEAFLR